MAEIQENPLFQACAGNLTASVSEETVLLHVATGSYFGLNEVASRAWQLLQAPMSIEALVDKLRGEFDVSEDILRPDMLRLLRELESSGLVEKCRG